MSKKSTNGFALFMKDLAKEMNNLEKRNVYTMSNIGEIAGSKWSQLSPERKSNYNEKALAIRQRTTPGRIPELVKYASNEETIENDLEFENRQTLRIDNIFSNFQSMEEIVNVSFYVVSFNVLTATRDGNYIPIELGIVRYTLNKGVVDFFHKLIEPGAIPLGYLGAAKLHSEATHKIPIMNNPAADDDYRNILTKIINFVQEGDDELEDDEKKEIVVFSHRDQLTQNKSCMEWLLNKVESRIKFHFTDISLLLIKLRMVNGNPFTFESTAHDLLKNNGFDFAADTRCDFHEDIDNQFCALGFTRKLCFIISDALPQFLEKTNEKELLENDSKYSSIKENDCAHYLVNHSSNASTPTTYSITSNYLSDDGCYSDDRENEGSVCAAVALSNEQCLTPIKSSSSSSSSSSSAIKFFDSNQILTSFGRGRGRQIY